MIILECLKMKIKKITKKYSEEPVKFYDITVDKHHNFFISDSKILVHNSSIEKAISRLAKPYDCSESLLIGDGFFGNQITQEAASARYTAVKINTIIQNLINLLTIYHYQ